MATAATANAYSRPTAACGEWQVSGSSIRSHYLAPPLLCAEHYGRPWRFEQRESSAAGGL
jgi:hypothetical protein